MRFQHYLLIFLAFMICVFTPIFVKTIWNSRAETQNEILADYVSSAAKDAAEASDLENQLAFNDEMKRDNAIKVFYESLYENFNAAEVGPERSMVNGYIPCVLLIDNDGIYVNYRGLNTDNLVEDNGYVYHDFEYKCTPIHTYSETYKGGDGEYMVVYTLNKTASIYDAKTGTMLFSGSYESLMGKFDSLASKKAYEDIIKNIRDIKAYDLEGREAYIFNNDKEAFDDEAQYIVYRTVTAQSQYYINVMNQNGNNRTGKFYQITIPQASGIKGSTKNHPWGQALSGPTVMSFIQGEQNRIFDNESYNIYAIAGGKIGSKDVYYIQSLKVDGYNVKFYHTADCSELTNTSELKKYYSMEECAKMDAYPHQECISQKNNY